MAAPNLKEIEWAIQELENEESSKAGYILLAALYTCRNELLGPSATQPIAALYSETAPVTKILDQYGESEFLQTVAGKDQKEAWRIMDELMSTLQLVNPRVYDGVLRKFSKI